ncbi:MAG: nucleoside monophosphate kinase [Planctomycetaceae bacterium]|nr:nucleoside monophosphate kinase [Planctomycetaceae bacterium]
MSPTKRFRCVPLFGPPGVGKGTQGRILAEIPGFFHLSVGDVFRSIDIGSKDGREVYEHISRGELVPDELTIKIWRTTVEAYVALSRFKPREDLLILDGMPRNVHQVQMVQEYLEIHRIIFIKCSDEEDMIHRIRRRAIRENRTDDANEDVIRHRFEVYRRVTAPVLEQYDPAIIHEVDANGSPAEVLRSILECLIPVQNELFEANRREDEARRLSQAKA